MLRPAANPRASVQRLLDLSASVVRLLLPRLHLIPQFLVNDAQLRRIVDHPLRLRLLAPHELEPIGVARVVIHLVERRAVPTTLADVDLVVEKADLALGRVYSGVRPAAAARGPYSQLVKFAGDHLRRPAVCIPGEDLANPARLLVIDRQPAGGDQRTPVRVLPNRVFLDDRTITIGPAARVLAFECLAHQTAMSFLR
nr:hypothetical protein [Dongia deserti]